jgi:hypothetical protein
MRVTITAFEGHRMAVRDWRVIRAFAGHRKKWAALTRFVWFRSGR